ncbi:MULTISPECIES: MATE family efflux transporter [Megasphaera]|jgi:putative MATE family efflux protein|uniref:MATE family efflux transporter n=1 Tax=Megasphaera TaxID=906 RepID=UPI0018EA17D7|nr:MULTISPECIES: MATE family efflux transporter [Megasphaera]
MVKNMTAGSPIRLILSFTVPLLIGNVFQQFYNIADIIIVGRTIGVHALAAVGASGPLFMALLGLTIGLTSGFSVVTGQRFGANDDEGVRRSVAMSAMLAVGLTVLLTTIAAWQMPLLMELMNISDELYDDSYSYIIIITYGIVAMMMYNLLACICRALGDSRTPLYFLILSSVLNVVLALVFIMQFGWGVPGSAIALVIAQGVSALLCFFYMRRRFPMLRLRRGDWAFDREFAWQHLRLGLPMAMQFMIISLGILAIQSVCNTFGPETIAGFVSATRIEQLALQPMISFGIAMAVYSAQNYGAQKYDRIRKGVRQCSLVSLCFCLFAIGAMLFYGQELISVFTTEHDDLLLQQAMLYLHTSVPFYIFLGQIFVYRNALQGMGISSVPLISSIIELVFRGLSAFVLAGMWGFFGICCASPICWVAACLFTAGSYFYVQHTMRKIRR